MSSSSPGCYDQAEEDSEDSIEEVTDSDSSSIEEIDEFDQYANYKGIGQVKTRSHYEQQIMCLHYFSDALGLQFGANEEVWKIDQIKEWATPPDSKWLMQPPEHLLGCSSFPFLLGK